jgi:hypothetical protein
MLRFFVASLALMLPVLCLGADDSRPACGSHNQGQLWPEAANHDPKVLSHLMRCGELFLCVRGTWHYHWEAPSIRLDQLARHAKPNAAKPSACEEQPAAGDVTQPDPAAAKGFR